MVYKSGQIFLPFCHNSRMWRTDRRTDRQTDGRTEISSQYRVCITCSAVKTTLQAFTFIFFQHRYRRTDATDFSMFSLAPMLPMFDVRIGRTLFTVENKTQNMKSKYPQYVHELWQTVYQLSTDYWAQQPWKIWTAVCAVTNINISKKTCSLLKK